MHVYTNVCGVGGMLTCVQVWMSFLIISLYFCLFVSICPFISLSLNLECAILGRFAGQKVPRHSSIISSFAVLGLQAQLLCGCCATDTLRTVSLALWKLFISRLLKVGVVVLDVPTSCTSCILLLWWRQ